MSDKQKKALWLTIQARLSFFSILRVYLFTHQYRNTFLAVYYVLSAAVRSIFSAKRKSFSYVGMFVGHAILTL